MCQALCWPLIHSKTDTVPGYVGGPRLKVHSIRDRNMKDGSGGSSNRAKGKGL